MDVSDEGKCALASAVHHLLSETAEKTGWRRGMLGYFLWFS